MLRDIRFFLAIAIAACFAGCQASQLPATTASDSTQERAAQVERGRYLVNIGGCNDCHTPLKMTDHGPEPDMTRMLSGHPAALKMPAPPALPDGSPWAWTGAATSTAFAGAWGVTYAFNLTPDQNSGLGIWTEDMFVRAMRTGRHMGTSRPIMPPMPWQNIGKLTDDDLKALYAYLRSIPPISNQVPDYAEPAFGR
jgi:hypothetical protein